MLKHRPDPDLTPRLATALLAAAAAGAISGFAAAHVLGANSLQQLVPALLIAAVVAVGVLAVGAFLIAVRVRPDTVERLAGHLLRVVFALAALPGLAWLVLWLSDGDPRSLYGLAAIVLGALPLLAARRWPARLPLTVALCLVPAVLPLVLWHRLFLLTPISAAVTGGWVLVLALLGYARHRTPKNVVPSN
ncbi:hypothetical protein FNH05_18270 [Amycolatopsis rhizosphaerae]|uniref:Uncharacterized protein n=1 Tax=Amycolatopsis rhizosphaerae TaxID=2053003 RepID=A0A558CH38_9PSEU|nr:hypothetical protein [Amycolatopsis rhizosphaerae]TVT48085.1 hypothetical protein FNH05_18270 [Amycolatopsis rhizosphaerae]